jgi:hypothetical protein
MQSRSYFILSILFFGMIAVSSQSLHSAISEYWLAYNCGAHICVQSESGQVVQLTQSSEETNSHPIWSPDASKIYFAKQFSKEEVIPNPNPNISPSEFKEKNSDIYVRDLSKLGEQLFYGKPIQVSAFSGAGGMVGIESPLGFSKKSGYFIFEDLFNYPTGTLISNGQFTASYSKLRVPFYVDTALSKEAKKGFCQVDPELRADFLQATALNFTPNEEWLGGASSYAFKHPSSNGQALISSESGITSCSVNSPASKRLFDQTMDKKLLGDTAADFNGGIAFNDDGSLYHLPPAMRSVVENILKKPLGEGQGFEKFYLSPDRESLAFIHENKIYMVSPKQNLFYLYPTFVSKLIAWSQDGKRLLAQGHEQGGNQALVSLDPLNGSVHEISIPQDSASFVSLSPVPLNFQIVADGNANTGPVPSNSVPASCSLRR